MQGNGSAASAVAPIEDPQPAALHQYPHVGVQNQSRAATDEHHLLRHSDSQLIRPTVLFVLGVGVWLQEQAEWNKEGQEPSEEAQKPRPVARCAGGAVAHWVTHGTVSVHCHDSEGEEGVRGAANENCDHEKAGAASWSRDEVDLVVEDAAHAQVDEC